MYTVCIASMCVHTRVSRRGVTIRVADRLIIHIIDISRLKTGGNEREWQHALDYPRPTRRGLGQLASCACVISQFWCCSNDSNPPTQHAGNLSSSSIMVEITGEKNEKEMYRLRRMHDDTVQVHLTIAYLNSKCTACIPVYSPPFYKRHLPRASIFDLYTNCSSPPVQPTMNASKRRTDARVRSINRRGH